MNLARDGQHWKTGIVGSSSSFVSLFVGQPLDTIRTRLQTERTRYKGISDCFMKIIRNESAMALYRGMSP